MKCPAHTGRCNLEADTNGIVLLDAPAITAANLVDEAITIATLADKTAVRQGQTIATVKIIPFGVPSRIMAGVEAALSKPAARVISYQPKNFTLINTILPGLKPSVIESTAAITRERITGVSGKLNDVRSCPHQTDLTTQTITDALTTKPDIILIAGASATVDRGDVIPAAIAAAGGVIDHVGMPVDPGNLLAR